MQIRPIHWFIILVTVLTINALSAGLLERFVYYELDKAIYDKHNQFLLQVQSDVQSQLATTPETQWQAKALELEVQFDAASTILPKSPDAIEDYILEKLEQPQFQLGYIDLETAAIYFLLDDQNVLELGPIPYKSFLVHFADYLPWLTALLINSLILVTYIKWQQERLTHALKSLSPIAVAPEKDIDNYFQNVVDYVANIEENNQQRLILQRDLLHGVAHEFRSPMARIQFALDMLDEAAPDEQIQLQKTMNAALLDLDGLVKELLYYARLKDESTPISLTQFELADAVQSAIEKVQPFYPHIDFQGKASAEQMISADQNLIHRMLVNLLRNAGRFANRVCRVHWQADATSLYIVIEDDGMGIPPGKTERIFEPFTRLDPSRSRDSGGCGLGLAIVASIVAKHQGQIRLLPHEPGDNRLCGACFEIQLPL